MANSKNKYGQYMTPSVVADFMVSLAGMAPDSEILEPSSGHGVFIDALKKAGHKNITAYEIDPSIISDKSSVICGSFITEQVDRKFDLIIGNPPYIRWKNLEQELKDELLGDGLWNQYCNSLCDYAFIFIIKSIELLKNNGRLIFITPEYWLNTTHSKRLRNYMLEHGSFEEIYHFNETPIFVGATVSTIIFNFRKKKTGKNIKIAKYFANKKLSAKILDNLKNSHSQESSQYITIPQFEKNKNWLLAPPELVNSLKLFEENCSKITDGDFFENNFYTIKDVCDIGNGLVSGLDKAFQVQNLSLNDIEKKNLLKVVKAKHLNPFVYDEITQYFMNNEVIPDEDTLKINFPAIYEHFQKYKEKLNKRYQYNRKINYWEWVFPRSFRLFSKNVQKIFVPCKERISNKNHFRFALVEAGIYPTQDVTAIVRKDETEESIHYILAILNSKYVFDWLRFNGIVKGNIVEFSEKPIASIPYRKINFQNKEEVEIHTTITQLTKSYICNRNLKLLRDIEAKINQLFV